MTSWSPASTPSAIALVSSAHSGSCRDWSQTVEASRWRTLRPIASWAAGVSPRSSRAARVVAHRVEATSRGVKGADAGSDCTWRIICSPLSASCLRAILSDGAGTASVSLAFASSAIRSAAKSSSSTYPRLSGARPVCSWTKKSSMSSRNGVRWEIVPSFARIRSSATMPFMTRSNRPSGPPR
ncbi:hypothetical protein SCALM49S_08817 [Streptomyces californicus]